MKPRVLVTLLTGYERQHWINPELTIMLCNMVRDSRFQVDVTAFKAQPHEVARNHTVVCARDRKFDWLVSLDNDNFMPTNTPLDVIAAAGPAQSVIGLTYGIRAAENSYTMYPPPGSCGIINGVFQEAHCVGGGVLMVNKKVWEKIPKGPYFRWVHGEGTETLDRGQNGCGEDVYFCKLVQQHGFTVWTHTQLLAGHHRSVDLTGMVSTMTQLRRPQFVNTDPARPPSLSGSGDAPNSIDDLEKAFKTRR